MADTAENAVKGTTLTTLRQVTTARELIDYEEAEIPVGQDVTKATVENDLSYKAVFSKLIFNSIPLALSNIILYLNPTITLYFLKQHEDNSVLGAFGLAGSMISVVSLAVFISLNIGLTSRAAQAFGIKDNRLVGLYFHRGLVINIAITIPCISLFLLSYKLCLMFGYHPKTAFYIHQYLSLSIPGLVFQMLFKTITAYLQACGKFAVMGTIEISANLLYCGLSYWLIGVLDLGVTGAAIGFNAIYLVSTVAALFYVIVFNPAPDTFFWLTRDSFRDICSLFRHELLAGSMVYLEWIAYEVIFLASGRLSTVQVTALTVSTNNATLIYSVSYALADTILAFSSTAMGEKNVKNAKKFLKAGLFCSVVAIIFVGLYCIFLSDFVIRLYINDAETFAEAQMYFRTYLIQVPPDFINLILASVLRAIGKEEAGTILMIIIYYLIAIPLSYTCCFVFGLGGLGLILGLSTSFYITLAGLLYIFWKINWDKQAEIISKMIEKDNQGQQALRECKKMDDIALPDKDEMADISLEL